jgi:hypothetical protein
VAAVGSVAARGAGAACGPPREVRWFRWESAGTAPAPPTTTADTEEVGEEGAAAEALAPGLDACPRLTAATATLASGVVDAAVEAVAELSIADRAEVDAL